MAFYLQELGILFGRSGRTAWCCCLRRFWWRIRNYVPVDRFISEYVLPYRWVVFMISLLVPFFRWIIGREIVSNLSMESCEIIYMGKKPFWTRKSRNEAPTAVTICCRSQSVTKIIDAMKVDRRNGGHANLRHWQTFVYFVNLSLVDIL